MRIWTMASMIAILLMVVPFAASAQETLRLDVAAAVKMAMEANPDILATRERLTQLEAQRSQAFSSLLPSIDATTTAIQQKDALAGRAPRFGGEPYNEYAVALGASQVLYRLGAFSARDVAKRNHELATIDFEIARRDLTARVLRAYYAVLLGEKLLESLEQNEKVSRETLSTALERARIGRGQLLDVLQVRTQLSLISARIARARSQISVATSELATLIARPDAARIEVTGQLQAPSVAKVQSRFAEKIRRDDSRLPEFRRILVSESRLEAEERAVIGANYPSLAATGTWGRTTTAFTDLFDGDSTRWAVGLELSVPLFSGLSSVYERRGYASQRAQLDLGKRSLDHQISLSQVRSEENLAMSEKNIAALSSSFGLARQSFQEALRTYRLQTIDFLQYLSVQSSLIDAESALDQARYDYLGFLIDYFVSYGLSLEELVRSLAEDAV